MLSAKTVMLNLRQQALEAVVEHKDELLKIFDRVVEVKAPRDVTVLHIRRDKRRPTLFDRVDHILKLPSVAADQFRTRDSEQILNAANAEIVENVECVLCDVQVA